MENFVKELVVNSSAMTALYLQLIVVVSFPIAALIIIKVRTKGSIVPFFMGGTVYVVFSVLIIGIIQIATVLAGLSPSIDGNPILYCLYHAVVVGIAEETGRFLAFKVFMRGLEAKEVPITYAIGHAGFETLTFVAVPALAKVSFASSFMELGISGMMEQNAKLTSEQITEMINQINEITVGQTLLTLGERLVWFALHVALSVIIFYGVRKKYTSYLWVCVGLRAISSIPSSMIVQNVFTNDVIGLILVTVITLLICYPAVKLYANPEKEYPNFFELYLPGGKKAELL